MKSVPEQQLPVKWKHSAVAADNLPTLKVAIQEFRLGWVKHNIGLVSVIHTRHSRFCVYGCKLAVEYTANQTLHLRMRPPGAPWLIDAAQVSTWPELNSLGNLLIRGGARISWLDVATANLFEAWSKTFLPDGYRFANPLHAIKAGMPELSNPEQYRESWLADVGKVMPRPFLQAFNMTARLWMELPDLVAPMRVWNRHREELIHPDMSDAWVRLVKPVLACAPVNLDLGATLEQSIRNLIVQDQSLTAWRFHRQTNFHLLTGRPGGRTAGMVGPLQFIGHQANCISMLITVTVKGVGMKRAQRLLLGLGEDRITRMAGALAQMGLLDATMMRLDTVMARAAERVESAGDELPRAHEEVVHVVSGLARAGFDLGFPAPNSTWASLVERANEWAGVGALWGDKVDLPITWKAAIPEWRDGELTFTALQSLKELEAEGLHMRHCVGNYHQPCALGNSVIYRIAGWLSIDSRVRATVEFGRHFKTGDWRISQIVGRENSDVDPRLRGVANKLAQALPKRSTT